MEIGYIIISLIVGYMIIDIRNIVYGIFRAEMLANLLHKVSIYFVNINTLIHELSHIVMVKVCGFKALKINLNSDGSGTAHFGYDGGEKGLRKFLVAMSGYIGASTFTLVYMFLIIEGYYKESYLVILGIVGLSLLIYVRNLYGVWWSLIVLSLMGFGYMVNDNTVYMTVSMLIGGILMVSQVVSVKWMIENIKRKREGNWVRSKVIQSDDSDAEVMWKMTGISAYFWAYGMLIYGVMINIVIIYSLVTGDVVGLSVTGTMGK